MIAALRTQAPSLARRERIHRDKISRGRGENEGKGRLENGERSECKQLVEGVENGERSECKQLVE
jgi:hypothetical protein